MTKHDFAKQFSRWLRAKLPYANHGRYVVPPGIWTHKRLAQAIGVDLTTVSWWKAGAYSDGKPCTPGREHCIAIAKALGEPVDRVLLLAGHAPEADPEEVYRKLHPDPMAERKLVAL